VTVLDRTAGCAFALALLAVAAHGAAQPLPPRDHASPEHAVPPGRGDRSHAEHPNAGHAPPAGTAPAPDRGVLTRRTPTDALPLSIEPNRPPTCPAGQQCEPPEPGPGPGPRPDPGPDDAGRAPSPLRPRARPTVATPPRDCGPRSGADGTDADEDGLVDSCEQFLAETFSPVTYHSSDESNYPTNVDWFLRRTDLFFYDDDCTPDLNRRVTELTSQEDLLWWEIARGCGAQNVVSSDGTRSNAKQRTFYLEDVPPPMRRGSTDSRAWTTYFHAYREPGGGVVIQYWRFYAYNDAANDHGGDWEGVHVALDGNLQPRQVGFLGHSDIQFVQWSNLQVDGTHPWVFSEGGGHASSWSGADIDSRGCPPAPGMRCVVDPNNPATFIRQETWTGGEVRWFDGRVTPGGQLLNVGSKTRPLNGQVFVQYSGIWGSPGTFFGTSGYWGPAFNETGMRRDGFITAWCNRMGGAPAGECYPRATSR
jgi:hypothetical protein